MLYSKFRFHAGGVGRNITEALWKLGNQPVFISAIGNDNQGQYLQTLLPPICSQDIEVHSNTNTAQCIVIFDSKGDCKMLLGDMDIHQQITPATISKYAEIMKESPLIVMDGNLSIPTVSTILKLAEEFNIPVFFEPTDVPVSVKPFQTQYWKSVKYITPNVLELIEIANTLNISLAPDTNQNHMQHIACVAKSIAEYIPNVIVTLGSNGLLIARKGDASESLNKFKLNGEIQIRHYAVKRADHVVNVSGAGDCLASGIISAMLKGHSEEQCVSVGYAAARASLYSYSPVPSKLIDQDDKVWNVKATFETL